MEAITQTAIPTISRPPLCPQVRRNIQRELRKSQQRVKHERPGSLVYHRETHRWASLLGRLLLAGETPAGLRYTGRSKRTGTRVSVYDGEAAGMDTDAGRWQTVCEDHGTICSHSTLSRAMSHAHAADWCEECLRSSYV